jgi:hypothetical protein
MVIDVNYLIDIDWHWSIDDQSIVTKSYSQFYRLLSIFIDFIDIYRFLSTKCFRFLSIYILNNRCVSQNMWRFHNWIFTQNVNLMFNSVATTRIQMWPLSWLSCCFWKFNSEYIENKTVPLHEIPLCHDTIKLHSNVNWVLNWSIKQLASPYCKLVLSRLEKYDGIPTAEPCKTIHKMYLV